MLRIGQFSKLSRVSIKALRYYDDIGLLKPAYVDRFTGYRYYAADQLSHIRRLLKFKKMGFSLEQIEILLDERLSSAELHQRVSRHRAELAKQLSRGQSQLAEL